MSAEDVAEAARALRVRALSEMGLCDACLGRLVGKAGHGLANDERGATVREIAHTVGGACTVCEGLTAEYPKFADLVCARVEPYEFDTFLIGSKVDAAVVAREEALWSATQATRAEAIKSEVNREVGKLVASRLSKEVDFHRPDIMAVVDTAFDVVDLDVRSLFVFGRYRKLVRGIPQTRWPCRTCRGKGCDRCDGKGKMYDTSVEEEIARPLLRAADGSGHALHGMGREDVDARMLGRGRPFVLEIQSPHVRRLDLDDLQCEVNRGGLVEVDDLRRSDRDEVVSIKMDRATKTYRVRVRLGDSVENAKVQEGISALVGVPIVQRTPARVVHRRADRARERRVVRAEVLSLRGTDLELLVTAEAGMYVKELVHGDAGRTVPSLAAQLGIPCQVDTLDVLEVHVG